MFRAGDGQVLHELRRGTSPCTISCICFRSDDRLLAVASASPTVHIFRLDVEGPPHPGFNPGTQSENAEHQAGADGGPAGGAVRGPAAGGDTTSAVGGGATSPDDVGVVGGQEPPAGAAPGDDPFATGTAASPRAVGSSGRNSTSPPRGGDDRAPLKMPQSFDDIKEMAPILRSKVFEKAVDTYNKAVDTYLDGDPEKISEAIKSAVPRYFQASRSYAQFRCPDMPPSQEDPQVRVWWGEVLLGGRAGGGIIQPVRQMGLKTPSASAGEADRVKNPICFSW